ncbi:hypothetical protein H2201_007762 [Coniosporium apollinis]|uniref:Uncharacterized protein n=1 Tax=Coniosporium apollinis TaxID=61459 RepID=A0ABQ9NK49_9PEZI|nr:hypothetical protein H2201_007762 [Coniosporium apollinis]
MSRQMQEMCELGHQIYNGVDHARSLVRQALNGMSRVLVTAGPRDALHLWDDDAGDVDWKTINHAQCLKILQTHLNDAIMPGTAQAVEVAHLATITKQIVECANSQLFVTHSVMAHEGFFYNLRAVLGKVAILTIDQVRILLGLEL